MKGYAPGWQIRCASCGRTKDAGEAGITRLGAASTGKRVLGWCKQCCSLRFLILEEAERGIPEFSR